MSNLPDGIAAVVGAITALGALGTASAGLVDATKAFDGGFSNFGMGHLNKALEPFASALNTATTDWKKLVRANWINGAPKEDQKAAVKSLIRLGLSSANADGIAKAGHVNAQALKTALSNVETGKVNGTDDVNVLGRLNAMIDLAMDAGFERADQQYRNACKLASGAVSVVLAVWAGQLLAGMGVAGLDRMQVLFPSILAGLLAVPISPIAKDLASSLQAAAKAVQAVEK